MLCLKPNRPKNLGTTEHKPYKNVKIRELRGRVALTVLAQKLHI
jgi:hypothetical protein